MQTGVGVRIYRAEGTSDRSGRAEGAAGAPAVPQGLGSPRLDIPSTYDSKLAPTASAIRAKIFRYPCGAVEVVCVPERAKNSLWAMPTDLTHRNFWEENARRAATQFRRACLTADLRYMLTTTTRSNILDFCESRDHITRLMRELRRRHAGIAYMGAPEEQKRGAWHWHVLIDRRLEAVSVRSTWRNIVGSAGGNIDLQYFHDPVKGALYASKYVRKTFAKFKLADRSAKYLRSRNIEVAPVDLELGESLRLLSAAGWSGEMVKFEHGGFGACSWR
jgi:hypothetical protein